MVWDLIIIVFNWVWFLGNFKSVLMYLINFKILKEYKRKKSNKNYLKGKEFWVNFR